MNKVKSQTILIISAAALIVAFILIIGVIVPKVNQLKQKNMAIAAKQQELDLGKKKVEALRAAELAIKTAKNDLDKLGVSIPYKEKSEEALAQLAAIATDSKTIIKTVSIGSSETGQLNVSITIEGNYNDTLKFISDVEKNIRPTQIRDYSMSWVEDQQSLNSTFNLIFPYVYEQPQGSSQLTPTTAATATSSVVPGQTGTAGIQGGL